jgi:hypothetical protein
MCQWPIGTWICQDTKCLTNEACFSESSQLSDVKAEVSDLIVVINSCTSTWGQSMSEVPVEQAKSRISRTRASGYGLGLIVYTTFWSDIGLWLHIQTS